jgi:hypothetical protein
MSNFESEVTPKLIAAVNEIAFEDIVAIGAFAFLGEENLLP